jgi:hypothetical protein
MDAILAGRLSTYSQDDLPSPSPHFGSLCRVAAQHEQENVSKGASDRMSYTCHSFQGLPQSRVGAVNRTLSSGGEPWCCGRRDKTQPLAWICQRATERDDRRRIALDGKTIQQTRRVRQGERRYNQYCPATPSSKTNAGSRGILVLIETTILVDHREDPDDQGLFLFLNPGCRRGDLAGMMKPSL